MCLLLGLVCVVCWSKGHPISGLPDSTGDNVMCVCFPTKEEGVDSTSSSSPRRRRSRGDEEEEEEEEGEEDVDMPKVDMEEDIPLTKTGFSVPQPYPPIQVSPQNPAEAHTALALLIQQQPSCCTSV